MNNKFKRVSKMLLALALIVTIMPLNVYAGEFSYTEVIAPTYKEARSFSEGLAAVKKDGKWGYIDTDEKTVIDFKYDVAYSFRENKAVVGTVKHEESEWMEEGYDVLYWGVIDQDDNYAPLMKGYEEAYEQLQYEHGMEYYLEEGSKDESTYYNGMVMMSIGDGPDRLIFDGKGKDLFDNGFPMHVATEDILATYYGYEDLKGNKLFEDKNITQTRPFNQGLAAVQLDDNEHWNLMDRNGKIKEGIEFDNFYVGDIEGAYKLFNDNSLMSLSDMDGKWGAINKAGKTIIPFQYEKLYPFIEGVAAFKKGGKFGYIDVDGNEVIQPQFDDASGFNNGLAAVKQGNKAFIIDKKGDQIKGTENLPKDSYFIESDDGDIVSAPGKYVLTKQNSKYGYGKIDYTPSLPTVEEMSDWALDEVVLAVENNLVPGSLQNMYRTDITRVDFAALVVTAIEEVTGQDINDVLKKETGQSLYELVNKYPFKDTTDQNVIAAQALKIINGRGEGVFAPNDTILRQEAAALLTGTARFLGKEAEFKNKTFNDDESIADYAKESVNYVSSIEVMGGKENNNFAPRDNYTREQAYVTIYRLFDVIINK